MKILLVVLALFLLLIPAIPLSLLAWNRSKAAEELQKQLNALRDDGIPVTPAELDTYYPEVPDAENAALLYALAFEALVAIEDGETLPQSVAEAPEAAGGANGADSAPQGDPTGPALADSIPQYYDHADGGLHPGDPLTPQQRAAMTFHLDRNRVALALLHEATALPRCRFPVVFDGGVDILDMTFLHFSPLRESCRLLCMEALEHALAGETGKAVTSLIAARRVGRALDQEPTVVSALVSIAIDEIATIALQDLLSRVEFTEGQCEALATVWEKGLDAPRIERGIAGDLIGHSQILSPAVLGGQGLSAKIGTKVLEGSGLLDRDRAFMAATGHDLIRAHRRPLPKRIAAVDVLSARAQAQMANPGWQPSFLSPILLGLWLPPFTRTTTAEVRAHARTRMAIIALRLEQLKRRNGSYPDSLDAVAAAFPEVDLNDPFTGDRLHFQKTKDGALLYCVGADAVADGGDDSEKWCLEPDMVFHIKR